MGRGPPRGRVAARSLARACTTTRSGSARGPSATSWPPSGASSRRRSARSFPTVANFSDGAVYNANFYAQGVDYFELLDADDQNAIWGEDWANSSSTYQCAAFNVDLMRAAARQRGQPIGHYLIAYAGRMPWDMKLEGDRRDGPRREDAGRASTTARSGRATRAGPLAKHLWYAKPEHVAAHAELAREIGAAEDCSCRPCRLRPRWRSSTAPPPTSGRRRATWPYGFDRMHTWLALAHAQTPVDIVSEAASRRRAGSTGTRSATSPGRT